MSNRSANKIEIVRFEDLFCKDIEQKDRIIEVSLTELYTFKNHPFHITQNSEMDQMVESIKECGVLVPGICRRREEGGYEIVSGHRRKYACELAGKNSMPVIVKELNDDEATIAMVDANIQRENLLYSEKAYAYKLKFDALKHQGSKGNKLTSEKLGEENKESGRQVQRYIRLTNLLPELLQMVDNKKISFTSAVEISYLGDREQKWLLYSIQNTHCFPKYSQATEMHDAFMRGELSEELINKIMSKKEPDKIQINIPIEKINKYIPENFNKKDVIDLIIQLLDKN